MTNTTTTSNKNLRRKKLTPTQRRAKELGLARRIAKSAIIGGFAASIAANLIASDPTPLGWGTGLLAPVFLFMAIELIIRVPAKPSWRSFTGITLTVVLAAITGWTSYWHCVETLTLAGENETTAHLLAFAPDLTIGVAILRLHEINDQINRPVRRRRAKTKKTAPSILPDNVSPARALASV